MLFCGPVTTNSMSELRDKNILGEKLESSLQHRQLTVLISKKDEKIRNYGINDGEVYLVVKLLLFSLKDTKFSGAAKS
jgi:hypothetical protein